MGGNNSSTSKSNVRISQSRRRHGVSNTYPVTIPDDDGDTDSLLDLYDDIDPNAFNMGFPPPSSPPNRKSDVVNANDFKQPDRLAREVEADDFESMEELVATLTQNFPKDIQKVRAIFMWIAYQPFTTRTYPDNVNQATPVGHLYRMALGSLSYAELFTIMCRCADIPCVMIPGIAKSSAYEVGDEDLDGLKNMWNAVYVAGGWRIVFLLWALRAIMGRSTGAGILSDINDMKEIREISKKYKEMIICNMKEYYFLTDPDEFIYRCLPNDDRWQLTKLKMTKSKFVRVPYLRPKFFEYGLEMSGTKEGVINTHDGVCDIIIKECAGHVPLTFDLLYNDIKSDKSLPPGIQLQNYGIMINEDDKIRFDIRLPAPGHYKFQVLDIEQEWVCSFKIICEEAKRLCEPFPARPEIGYGPSKVTLDSGLEADTHKTGVVKISITKETEIAFNVTKMISVKLLLIHNKISSEELQDYASHRQQFDKLTLTVGVPKHGEYALVILVKEKGKSNDYYNVCNYLLTTEDNKKNNRNYENATEKNARAALNESLILSDNPEELQTAVNKFNDLGLRDNGETEMAHSKLEYLRILNALKEGMNRRNLEILEKAISESKACNNPDLFYMTRKAEKEAEKLLRLKKYGQCVLSMSQKTISEMHRYKEPIPIIQDVMKAAFLLLGEDQTTVEKWQNLQNLMRKTGKDSLLARVRQFDSVNVNIQTAKQVKNILSPHDKESATVASAGAGTFHIWATNISEDVLSHSSSELSYHV